MIYPLALFPSTSACSACFSFQFRFLEIWEVSVKITAREILCSGLLLVSVSVTEHPLMCAKFCPTRSNRRQQQWSQSREREGEGQRESEREKARDRERGREGGVVDYEVQREVEKVKEGEALVVGIPEWGTEKDRNDWPGFNIDRRLTEREKTRRVSRRNENAIKKAVSDH